jgi:hypothetical protein
MNGRGADIHHGQRATLGETSAGISELKLDRSESCSKTRFFEGHHGVAVWCHGLLYTSSPQFLQHQASRLSCVLRLRFSPASGVVGVGSHQVLVHMKDLLWFKKAEGTQE